MRFGSSAERAPALVSVMMSPSTWSIGLGSRFRVRGAGAVASCSSSRDQCLQLLVAGPVHEHEPTTQLTSLAGGGSAQSLVLLE